MNLKRWALAAGGAFLVIAVADFVIHEAWLGGFYRANPQWWRGGDAMKAHMGWMFASQFVLALLLTLVYGKGYEQGKGTISQGFRFGALIGLLLFLPPNLMHYFVYPYPVSLLVSWFIGGLIETTLAGLMIGAIYKPVLARAKV